MFTPSMQAPYDADEQSPARFVRRYSWLVTMVRQFAPGLLMVLGLVVMLVGAAIRYSMPEGAALDESSLLSIAAFAPILFFVGLFLQAQQILSNDLRQIDYILAANQGYGAEKLELKLESLEIGLSVCRQAKSKIRPFFPLAMLLLAYGIVGTLLSFVYTVDVSGGSIVSFRAHAPDADRLDAFSLPIRILLIDAPPIALISAIILLIWYVFQRSQLEHFRQFITDERASVIGKKRILDRFKDRYTELSSLTEQVAELVRQTEQRAASDARKNAALLLLGVVLSAFISIVGVLGSADLLNWPVRLNGNVISAILGVIVAAIISVQNTFRLPEKAEFQKRMASDGRSLFVDLVFNVDTEEKLTDVVRAYQRLSDRSLRDLPSVKDLDALVSTRSASRGQEPDRESTSGHPTH